MESLFHLIDLCDVSKLAITSSSFEELCGRIRLKLVDYCKTNKISRGIEYITLNPQYISYANPEVVLWIFLLLNPECKFATALDPRRKLLLRNALSLDPYDYTFGGGYSYDRVAEKLQCSRLEGIYITDYWEILPIYLDKDRKTINLPYLIEKSYTAKAAAKLYSIYELCSMAEAESRIQEYLSKSAGDLSVLYPGGRLEISGNEAVMEIDLSDSEAGKTAWLSLNHPFFQSNSLTPELSAEAFFDFLSKSIYRYVLSTAHGNKDHHIEYSGYLTTGYESKEKIEFIRTEHYSYHDGGGGSEDSFRILALSAEKQKSLIIPKEIMTKMYNSKRKIFMPPCDGYWEDGDVLYMINPFGMKNIFVYEDTDQTWN